jgi:hypothetical protein
MKKFLFAAIVLSAFLVTGCGPSLKVTGSWVNEAARTHGKYQKVFLLAMTSNLSARQAVEDAQAKACEANGIRTVKSYTVITPDMINRGVDKDMIAQLVEQSGCDAVFTSALIDSKSETRYVPGSTYYQPYPSYGYYGNFGMYYNYHGSYVYDPGYYVEDQTYFIESNLYDVSTGDIMWSVQSEAYNPSNLKSLAQTYSAVLVDKLKKEGFLKKQ